MNFNAIKKNKLIIQTKYFILKSNIDFNFKLC